MDRCFFLKTGRIGFSRWNQGDIALANLLWGDPDVTRYICASGRFRADDIAARLKREIENDILYQVQYWPAFHLGTGELVGCCGLRPHGEHTYEIGFHLRPQFWGQGYAMEAANAVMDYAFFTMQAEGLFAGHHPDNRASQKLLLKLGFRYTGDEFYEPTGLYHPSYEYKRT